MQCARDVLCVGLDEVECAHGRDETIPFVGISCGVTNFKIAGGWSCEMSCLREWFDNRSNCRVRQSFEDAFVCEVS